MLSFPPGGRTFRSGSGVCGIRPEDLHARALVRTEIHGQVIDGRVDVTEMMGNERFLHVIMSGQKLMARVDPRTRARSGQDVSLLLDVDRVHLFGGSQPSGSGWSGA